MTVRPGRIIKLRYKLFDKVTTITCNESNAESITALQNGSFLVQYRGTNPAITFTEVKPEEYEIEMTAVEVGQAKEITTLEEKKDEAVEPDSK